MKIKDYIPKVEWNDKPETPEDRCKICSCPDVLNLDEVCLTCYYDAIEREYWILRKVKQ